MSFFKRNDPNAPAARRGGQEPYSRIPAEPQQRPPPQEYRQQPPQQYQPPPQQYQPPPPLPRRQDPYEEKYQSGRMYDKVYPTDNRYNIDPCPSDPLALSNRLVVNEQDFGDAEFAILRNQFIFSIM